ncbi:hypothetical protein NDU88_005970 [Pleurodeles waltl]|uniref:Uncharacterized protein n=1 Tax=Pleurodeles waltl TaxID=8319 RepID=A0AAV7L2S8_PLEWA|nr:hypothetical protein NDU88_005970 [Pleurodeles waltl]
MRPHGNIAWRDGRNIVDLLGAVSQMPDVLCLTDKNIDLASVVFSEMWFCGSQRGKEKARSSVKLELFFPGDVRFYTLLEIVFVQRMLTTPLNETERSAEEEKLSSGRKVSSALREELYWAAILPRCRAPIETPAML